MFKKLKALPKRIKAVVAAAPIAVVSTATTVVASAETTEATGNSMQSLMTSAGEQLQQSFSDLVLTLIPVIMGILGTSLVIFGIFALFKFGRKIFTHVAG